ncbi:MAG: 5'/3'-nucleotidase SurE [Gammaproteobacteria bacterium]|nr:5'/3'-nucleotidase SurE [Gammaproteobacteria bacterium]
MRILLSNDDGYQAAGLRALAEGLSAHAEVTVVAPDRDRSGASHSLTLSYPIRVVNEEGIYRAVDGTPTDCVHLAINGLLEYEPDMVISGINHGANLGDDVHYSGTVAAAMEGRFLGYPAIAVSNVSFQPKHLATSVIVIKKLLLQLQQHPLPVDTILNVNVPDLPWSELAGMQVTRLGSRHKSEPIVANRDPRGGRCYWIGPPGAEQDAGAGTDFYALSRGFVSITPLQVDMTQHAFISELQQWVAKV